MPTTLTLHNIPDELYARLKASAQAHGRSLSDEAIACLQTALMPAQAGADEHLQRVKAIHQLLAGRTFSAADIDAARREGRP